MARLSSIAATSIAVALGAGASAGDLIAYESFSYGATANLASANGGTGWASAWAKLSSIPTGAVMDGLEWPNLVTQGGTALTAAYPSADYTRYSRVIAPYTPGEAVYFSFLFMPNLGFGQGGGLAFGTWENGMVVGGVPGTGLYGLSTPPGDAKAQTTTPMVQNEVTLIVGKIEATGGGSFIWSLFVNPSVGAAESALPSTSMVSGLGFPQAVALYNDGGFLTDEIRFGHTWESVLPALEVPCPADLDGDGQVGGGDLGLLLGAWGGSEGDLNGDGSTDGSDLGVLLSQWGPCP